MHEMLALLGPCTCTPLLHTTNQLCPSCVAEWEIWSAELEEEESQKHRIYVSHDFGFIAGERLAS